MLAVNRANDPVIFVLLIFAALILACQTLLRIAAALVDGTDLKRHSIVDGAVFLLVRPGSCRNATLLSDAVVSP